MSNAHCDTNITLTLMLCSDEHVSVDDQPKNSGAGRLCCEFFQDGLGKARGAEIVENLQGESDEARAESIFLSFGIPLDKSESPERFQNREGLAFVDANAGTDLGKPHAGSAGTSQTEKNARGLLYRRNQIASDPLDLTLPFR